MMCRRTLLSTIVGSATIASAGCLSESGGEPIDSDFELTDAELAVEDEPSITVDGETVTVRGTIRYGSSSCGTVELAHCGYEPAQKRADVLVVAADDSAGKSACTDDLAVTGYRVECRAGGELRRVAATEHHVFGETYSSTVDGTNG